MLIQPILQQFIQMSQDQQFQAIKPYILQNFQQYRILQPQVVFLHGLPQKLASSEILTQELQQFGEIDYVSIQFISKNFYSAFAFFQDTASAALAISTLNNFPLQNRILRVSYASTKFCPNFLKGNVCSLQKCNYAHYYYPQLAHLKDFAKQINHDLIAQNKILQNYQKSLYLVYHTETQKRVLPSAQMKLRQIFYRKNQVLIQESLAIQKKIFEILLKSQKTNQTQEKLIKNRCGNDWECIDQEISEFIQEEKALKQQKSKKTKVEQFLQQAEQTLMNLIFKSSLCVY